MLRITAYADRLQQDLDPLDWSEAYCVRVAARSDRDRQEDKEKTGVFTGWFAINPVSGQPIPIWIADYVLDYLVVSGGRERPSWTGARGKSLSRVF